MMITQPEGDVRYIIFSGNLWKRVLYCTGLRLLAIGRNQYIDTMNQCRSSKVRLYISRHLLAATYMERHVFCKCWFFQNRFRRHLWTDLYETLTHGVYRSATEHYKEIFWVSAPKILGPKTTYSSQYLRRPTWYRQSGNGVGNYEGSHTSSQNFVNFGPLVAKNRTVVFTHPPKSSSDWQRWPSHWPALRHANISSFAWC